MIQGDIAMKHIAALAGSLLLISACETATPPAPAVTTFTSAICTAAPSVAGAASLTSEEPASEIQHSLEIGAESPCMRDSSGASTPYAVFALPTTGKPASVMAGGVIETLRLFAVSVSTLGADGKVVRTFKDGDFRQRGHSLAVLFTPRAEEKYVVIAAAPSRIGGAHSLVTIDPATAKAPAYAKTPEDIAAFRTSLARPYSYAGQVFTRVYFADPAPK